MKLPDADRAIVSEAKVRDYLLSSEHPVGRFKARVFYAAGYRRDTGQVLRDHLRALAATIDVTSSPPDAHGQRFVGAGALPGLDGQPLPIVTIWIIPSEGAPLRLITAYPDHSP